ncbi:MAG: lysophospholipid acyltransferase family protein [Candidatus Krumholzibacteria bacterium]|nr:lysophospholipid acyltransferase family protein [Candidatus Krumholzibacteria bacterium]
MFTYGLYKAGSFFARVLPLRISEAITWTIGQVSCLVRLGTRRNVEHNLKIIHGGGLTKRELRRMSRRVVMNFSRTIMVLLKLPAYRWEEIRERIDMSELESAIASLGERPAFLAASLHMGPWELGGLCLSRTGHKMHTVSLDHPSVNVTRFFDQRRRSIGVINHPMRKSYTILKEALEKGDCVGLLVDRAYGATHKRFEFFGAQQPFPLGHLFLSASTGVPIITCALVFDRGDRFKFVYGGLHFPPTEGTEDLDKLEELQAECLRDFEKIIREYSDQWFLFERLAEPSVDDNAD